MPKPTTKPKRETLKALQAEIAQERASHAVSRMEYGQRLIRMDYDLQQARSAIANAHSTIERLSRQFGVLESSLSLIASVATEGAARAGHFKKALAEPCGEPLG